MPTSPASPPLPAARRGRLRSELDLAAAMITVGSIVPAGKVISAALPPQLAGAARLAVAAAVLLPWALLRERPALLARRGSREAGLLLLQAAAGTVGFTVLLLLGVARTSAADASIITGALPAVAAALSVLLFREPVRRATLLAVALALAGVLAVSTVGAGPGPAVHRLGGDLLVLGAVASEALFILLQKRLRHPPPALSQAAVMAALGLAFLLPGAALEAARLELAAVPLQAWLAVAYYGLVPTVLGFYWWYRGAAGVTGAEAAVFTGVMPLSGAALSALWLGEPLGLRHLLGLLLVLAGILVSARRPPAGTRGGGPRRGR